MTGKKTNRRAKLGFARVKTSNFPPRFDSELELFHIPAVKPKKKGRIPKVRIRIIDEIFPIGVHSISVKTKKKGILEFNKLCAGYTPHKRGSGDDPKHDPSKCMACRAKMRYKVPIYVNAIIRDLQKAGEDYIKVIRIPPSLKDIIIDLQNEMEEELPENEGLDPDDDNWTFVSVDDDKHGFDIEVKFNGQAKGGNMYSAKTKSFTPLTKKERKYIEKNLQNLWSIAKYIPTNDELMEDLASSKIVLSKDEREKMNMKLFRAMMNKSTDPEDEEEEEDDGYGDEDSEEDEDDGYGDEDSEEDEDEDGIEDLPKIEYKKRLKKIGDIEELWEFAETHKVKGYEDYDDKAELIKAIFKKKFGKKNKKSSSKKSPRKKNNLKSGKSFKKNKK